MLDRRFLQRLARLAIGVLPIFLLVLASFGGDARGEGKRLKVLKGLWTCPVCDAKGLKGLKAECEDLGHKHALKLDDGTIIGFVENARSEALLVGGGRHEARIEIYGIYDSSAKLIDIDGYQLDGIWTTWCDRHGRMDMCRSGVTEAGEEGAKQQGR